MVERRYPNDPRRQGDLELAEQRGSGSDRPIILKTALAVILDEVELLALCRRTETPLREEASIEVKQNAVRDAVRKLVQREVSA